MTNTIDGFNFDLPLRAEQIIELAHHHRKNSMRRCSIRKFI